MNHPEGASMETVVGEKSNLYERLMPARLEIKNHSRNEHKSRL